MIDSAIIIPVHNRSAVTLACLERLAADDVSKWAQILVIDDGSVDGTADAIREKFPLVKVLSGNGNLWWAGSISLGMEFALNAGFDYVCWLNDDCSPAPGALRKLRDISGEQGAMAGGVCLLPDTEMVVYGGLRRRGYAFDLVVYRPDIVEHCDALSGNLVCLPIGLVRQIGLPDALHMPHAIADIDYALQAKRAGWPVLVVHGAIATAQPNNWQNHSSWLLSDLTIRDIWQSAWRKSSYGYFPTLWYFFHRHWGLRGAAHAVWLLLKRLIIIPIRLFVPQKWLHRIWANRSEAWQAEQRLRNALAGAPEYSRKSK